MVQNILLCANRRLRRRGYRGIKPASPPPANGEHRPGPTLEMPTGRLMPCSRASCTTTSRCFTFNRYHCGIDEFDTDCPPDDEESFL